MVHICRCQSTAQMKTDCNAEAHAKNIGKNKKQWIVEVFFKEYVLLLGISFSDMFIRVLISENNLN